MSDTSLQVRVTVKKDGPYVVTGSVPLGTKIIGVDAAGESVQWNDGDAHPSAETYALCRCGQSGNKPFCDGTHTKINFDGTETATREPFANQAKIFDGPTHQLKDVGALCASARFCDPNGQVWNQISRTDQPKILAQFVRQVSNCPSGRLVAWDKVTGAAVEPQLPISIALVEDPQQQCSGPLWLRGGIAVIAADGFTYEVRNRVTLCRCGVSQNKPFCDGAHEHIKTE
jgi:CDGSH-type Zn-finger protein